jgi:hypothetical protein
MDRGAMLGAPLLFAIELTILYAADYYSMGCLRRILGLGGSGGVLGGLWSFIYWCFLVWSFTKAPTFRRACSLERGSPASQGIETRLKSVRFRPHPSEGVSLCMLPRGSKLQSADLHSAKAPQITTFLTTPRSTCT